MPIENGIGFGEYTGVKIEHFRKILAMHMAITQRVIKKYTPFYDPKYHYVDMTAGQGRTPNGVLGSPLVFLDKAGDPKFDLPFRAVFIERELKNINELKKAVSAHPTSRSQLGEIAFYHNAYEKVIGKLFGAITERELGLVYVDPTGTKDLPDVETLALISTMRPRMEILFNLSSTAIKRRFDHTHKLLEDFLSATGKRHWLIRKPFKGDPQKWTLLLGSKVDLFKPYKSIRNYFALLDSPEGREVFEKMNLSHEQRIEQKQPRLF